MKWIKLILMFELSAEKKFWKWKLKVLKWNFCERDLCIGRCRDDAQISIVSEDSLIKVFFCFFFQIKRKSFTTNIKDVESFFCFRSCDPLSGYGSFSLFQNFILGVNKCNFKAEKFYGSELMN